MLSSQIAKRSVPSAICPRCGILPKVYCAAFRNSAAAAAEQEDEPDAPELADQNDNHAQGQVAAGNNDFCSACNKQVPLASAVLALLYLDARPWTS